MKILCCTSTLLIVGIGTVCVRAGDSLPSLRIDTADQTAGASLLAAFAQDFCQGIGPDIVFITTPGNTSNTVAVDTLQGGAIAGDSYALGQMMAEARLDPASGASLNVPQANATVGGQAVAVTPCGIAQCIWGTGAASGATLQILGIPTYPNGPATASESVNLTAAGDLRVPTGLATMFANAGGTSLTATPFRGGGWTVDVVIQHSSVADPGAPAEEYTLVFGLPGFNVTATGTELVGVSSFLTISALIGGAGDTVIDGQSSQWSYSAHGSYSVNAP